MRELLLKHRQEILELEAVHDESISIKRLLIEPTATLCIDCASQVEYQ